MVLGLVVFAVLLIVGAPLWVAIVSGVALAGVLILTGGQRRRERARRAAVHAARKAERKSLQRDKRKAAILERTGLDVDLVTRAAQDVVHTVGSRLNSKLEARYPAPPAPDKPVKDDWLDLDTDYDAMQSRRTTEEALRLNDELGRTRGRRGV